MAGVDEAALRSILESYFTVVAERSTPGNIAIICPEANCGDRTGNRVFSAKEGVTNCWRCGNPTSGNIARWLKLRDITIDSSDFERVESVQSTAAKLSATLNTKPIAKSTIDVVRLPLGFTPLTKLTDKKLLAEVALMAERKRLSLADFKAVGVGCTHDQSYDWHKYCIFPVYELNRLVYYQGRTYSMEFEGGATKRFPSKQQVPHGSAYWIYNWDNAAKPNVEVVIIVESMLNVISLRKALQTMGVDWAEPVAIFKHKLSPIQVSKLLLLGAGEFCLMFDGDALRDAWSEATKLLASKKVTIAEMPIGIDANDDVGLALQRFEARKTWSPLAALKASVGM